MSGLTGNYQLLALNETISENLSSVQIAETLDELIFRALTPLIKNSNYIEYAILELMPHIFLNQRRKFSNKEPESLKDAIFSFVMSDDKVAKTKLLRKQTLERTVYFTVLSGFEKDAKAYLESVRLRLKNKNAETDARMIKEKYLIHSELYETCQSVVYWLNYAYKFRAMIVEKYVRSAYNQSVKMAAATKLRIDQEELFRNLLVACHKAIDKYDSEKGPLAGYVDIWFMEAKTNYKNAHEQGVAMQMSTSQRKKLQEQGNLQTFTVELDDELASSIEDEEYNILGTMIESEEDKLLNNLSCRADIHKVFSLATGVIYTPTQADIEWQRSSCHGTMV